MSYYNFPLDREIKYDPHHIISREGESKYPTYDHQPDPKLEQIANLETLEQVKHNLQASDKPASLEQENLHQEVVDTPLKQDIVLKRLVHNVSSDVEDEKHP